MPDLNLLVILGILIHFIKLETICQEKMGSGNSNLTYSVDVSIIKAEGVPIVKSWNFKTIFEDYRETPVHIYGIQLFLS